MRTAVAGKFVRKRLERGLDLLNFSIVNLSVIVAAFLIAFGGSWTWFAIPSTFLVVSSCDELFSTYDGPPKVPKWFMEAQLQLVLPMLFILTLIALNVSSPTPLPVIDPIMRSIGFDTATTRVETNIFVVFFIVGFLYGSLGITAAHELCHRTDYRSQITSRWLLAFCWETGFVIEHIHGHHKNVGTENDPATARRGETLLQYLSRSVVGQVRGALQIEHRRLSQSGLARSIFSNRFYRGQLMSFVILLLYIVCLGWLNGILMCFFAAGVGKFLLETVNYIEHYGLVRVPGHPVESRHSWECQKRFSCYFLFNLPLHADHHQYASRRYYDLRAIKCRSPIMPFGYMVMFFVALFPPIWRRLIHPLLYDWDLRLASAEELQYLKRKNQTTVV